MPLFGRKKTNNNDTDTTDRREDRREDRVEKKDSRRNFILDKTAAVTEKFKAVALKREGLAKVLKWLVILMVVGYAVFSFSGLGSKLGIFTKFFGGGG